MTIKEALKEICDKEKIFLEGNGVCTSCVFIPEEGGDSE